MRGSRIFIATLLAASSLSAIGANSAVAGSRWASCGGALGGNHGPVYVKYMTCRTALRVANSFLGPGRTMPSDCYDNGSFPECRFRKGRWLITGHWITDRYGSDQQSLLVRGPRHSLFVVRTEWDGE